MKFLKRVFKKKSIHTPKEASLEVANACLTRAAELRLNGQNEAAIVECNNALLLHPNNHLAFYIRALAKYRLDDQEGAFADWRCAGSLRNLAI